MNTKNRGLVTFVTAKSSDSDEHIGFCYELAIVLESNNPDELINDLYDAAKGYIQTARENNVPDELLDKHQLLPKDLQDLYKAVKEQVDSGTFKNSNSVSKQFRDALNMGGAQLSRACV